MEGRTSVFFLLEEETKSESKERLCGIEQRYA
jgi:hypothetical protein